MSNRIKMMNKLRQALYGKPGREVKQPTQSDLTKSPTTQSDQKDKSSVKRRIR